MQRSRFVLIAALVMAWMALGVWQWYDYGAECRHARESLVRQADSIMHALTGGIRSHRRLGYYFSDQLEGVLEELVATQDVLAASVVSEDGRLVCSAGLDHQLSQDGGGADAIWSAGSLRYVNRFELLPHAGPPGGEGHGLGLGPGRGLGRGRAGRWTQPEGAEETAPFAEGGSFTATLLLDARPVAERCHRAAMTRMAIVAAGALVLFFVAIVWRNTFRLAEARGRERLLETEARYLRELSQAAAGLAHETRNPLGLIRGWTQRLAEADCGEQGRQRAHAIVEECDRLTARINQFLAYARPAAPRLERVSLPRLAAELAGLLEPDLKSKRVHLHGASMVTSGCPDPGRGERAAVGADVSEAATTSEASCEELFVLADRELFRQALFNLIQNAVQASPEEGTIEIRFLPRGDGRVCVEVADSGPGVPSELAGKLFTPYFTTRKDGTGLGLAIVRRIAVAHGWEAGHRPQTEGGSVFWIDGLQPASSHDPGHGSASA